VDDDPIMPEIHDPEWAKRMAAIEADFRKADRRRVSSKALAQPPRRPRRFRGANLWVGIIVVAIAYAAIAKPWGTEQVPVANAPLPIATQTDIGVASTPSAEATWSGASTTDPFAGGPAQSWPTADKGVIMPTATRIGPYTAAQVTTALNLARRYILMTRTDPRVLVAHQVQLLTAMVVPAELTGGRIRATGKDSIVNPTLLAPGNELSAPIRVNGTVNAAYHPDGAGNPMLQVTTNLVWAYPIVLHPGFAASGGTVAVIHDRMTLDLYPSDRALRSKVFVEGIRRYESNIDCEYADQGLLGLPRIDDPSRMPMPSGTMPTGNQAYNPDTPLDLGRNCK